MTSKTRDDWKQLAGQLTLPSQAWINGRAADALAGAVRPCINPASAELLVDVAECQSEDADFAVAIAQQVFEAGTWSAMAPRERKRILARWADLIEQHREELALLESLDVGKPIQDCFDIDVPSAVNTIRWTAEAIDKLYGEIAPTAAGTLALIQRLPLGVILAIVPWNFPLSTTAWKLAPALACGNSVILKPDPKTPLTALRIAQLASDAGLPDGVLNVVPGDGPGLGEHLCLHPGISGQTFTGSTAVGKKLMQYAGQSNLKRTFLELGGKSANIVFADADLRQAATWAAIAAWYNSGQTCTAGSRLLIQETIYDQFVDAVAAHAETWMPGDPLDPSTRMGAVIDLAQQQRIQGWVDRGVADGGRLVCGGSPVAVHGMGGCFYPPTLLRDVNNQMTIAREEVFGPVVVAIPFCDAADAVRIANDSAYGLAGAVWSRDISTALRVASGVRTGTMGVNNYFGGDITVPFGGFRQSGNGRDKSMHAMHDYSELKTTWIEY